MCLLPPKHFLLEPRDLKDIFLHKLIPHPLNPCWILTKTQGPDPSNTFAFPSLALLLSSVALCTRWETDVRGSSKDPLFTASPRLPCHCTPSLTGAPRLQFHCWAPFLPPTSHHPGVYLLKDSCFRLKKQLTLMVNSLSHSLPTWKVGPWRQWESYG